MIRLRYKRVFAHNLFALTQSVSKGNNLKILSLRVEEGFFNNLSIDFSTGLNVLVGGRGVGKTSVIELLRFGLGASNLAGKGELMASHHALSILQSTGRVTIDIELEDGHVITVSRSAQDSHPTNSSSYIPPIIFSQKEIETIGINKEGRLSLIDSFLPNLNNHQVEITQLSNTLRSLTAQYSSTKKQQGDLQDKASNLNTLKAREAELQQKHATVQANSQKIMQSQNEVTVVQQKIAQHSVTLQNLQAIRENIHRKIATIESVKNQHSNTFPMLENDWTKRLNESIRKRFEVDVSLLEAMLNNNVEAIHEIDQVISETTNQKVILESEARKSRTEVESHMEGAGAILSELGRVREEIAQIENYCQQASQKQEQLNILYQQAQEQLTQIFNIREVIFRSRNEIVTQLNRSLNPEINVQCSQQTNLSEYKLALEQAFKGSGLKYKELLETITQRVSPQWLFYYAVSNKYEDFAATLEIPIDRAARLLGYLSDIDLGHVLSSNTEDTVDLALLDHGQYKTVEELSIGQRCTVALSIILENTNRVLVIDQPEDHLDNEFVAKTLIKSIRQRALTAQTILSSHNANIPVLGNASMVINLDSNGRKGFVRTLGSIEDANVKGSIESIMEGGKDAFQTRAGFYQSKQL